MSTRAILSVVTLAAGLLSGVSASAQNLPPPQRLSMTGTPPEAEVSALPSRFTAAVDIGQRWHLDPSWQVFEASRAPTAGLNFAMDLTGPGHRFVLAAELGWTIESVKGTLRQAFETRLAMNEVRAAVIGRWQLFSWLNPYLRVGAGALHHDASLSANDGSGELVASGWGVEGFAGLGLMFQTGAIFRNIGWRRGRLMASIEGGMMLSTGVGLEVRPPTPDDEEVARDLLPVSSTTMGTVNASSAYLRVQIGLRF